MTLAPSEVRLVIIGAMLAMFLAALDQTIVATALPPIARDLGDFALISWVITAYLVTSTCVTPVVGKLSDLYGRRRTITASLALFMAASALCALAPSMPALIAARALQGLGGGGLIVLAQTAIGDVVSPRERGRYAAYFSAVWASASVLGPMVGGIVAEHYGWPWIFWINLPLGVLALVIADRALAKLPVDHRHSPIDYGSIAFLSGATVALLLILSLGGKRMAWTAPELVALGVITLALGTLFLRQQRRSSEPILPPRFLGDSVIRPVLAASFIVYGTYLAITVLVPIYFQVALGASSGTAGIAMVPLLFSSTVTAGLAGRYSRRTGRCKRPPLLGLPVSVAATALVAFFAEQLSVPAAALLFLFAGLGIGPIFPCTTVAAQNAVERHDLGAVTGAVGFARSLGAAVAVAAGSALVLGLIAAALPELGQTASLEDLAQHTLPPEARAIVARAFGIAFGAVTASLLLGFAVFARVEDRALRDRPALVVPSPADE
jgi:EmrB/QacA subfamily drug resistance transporter